MKAATHRSTDDGPPGDPHAPRTRADETPAPAVEEGGAPAPLDSPEALRAEVEALRDKNLRLLAELRNVRERAQRDKSEAVRYAEAALARDLLVVLDDLERTRASSQSGAELESVLEALRIVHEHFLKVLADHHIQPIEAEGRPFDPELHEALLQQPSADVPAGVVLQELAPGYRMHDRVIRAARVIVSSGPESAAPAE